MLDTRSSVEVPRGERSSCCSCAACSLCLGRPLPAVMTSRNVLRDAATHI